MRKILLAFLSLGLLFNMTGIAGATKPGTNPILINGHKVFICHNVSHNPHIILVDVASVDSDGNLKGGHGVWPAPQTDVSTFVPHDSGGHDQDFLFLSDESKPDCPQEEVPPVTVLVCVDNVVISMTAAEAEENDLTVIDSDGVEVGDSCGEIPTTTTTTAPPVVTTTTTTAPPVTTTTTLPTGTECVDTAGNPFVTSEPVCPSTSVTAAPSAPAAPAAPVAPATPIPLTSLPHTGSPIGLEASAAALMILLGLGIRKFATK